VTWFLLGWKYLPVWLFVGGIVVWLLVPILSPSIKMIHNEFGWRTFLRLVFQRRK
jgi:hypothetical protein